MLLQKFSAKFPRKILCARKSKLGVGIIKLPATINIMSLKLYVGNVRVQDRLATMIKIKKENMMLQNEYNSCILKALGRE